MKFTLLVIWFNKWKILAGLSAAGLLFLIGTFINPPFSIVTYFIATLIVINILLAVIASYFLFDWSWIFKPPQLVEKFGFKPYQNGILIHASFDPISNDLEKYFTTGKLEVFNIYGNRHENESAVALSNRIFRPNPKEKDIYPSQLPTQSNTVDFILAITALHEIQEQQSRIEFFQEAKRTLKENGELIVIEQMKGFMNTLVYNIGVNHFVAEKDWKDAIEQSGLVLLGERQLTPFAKILYLKKKNHIV